MAAITKKDLGAVSGALLLHVFDGPGQVSFPVDIRGGFNVSIIHLTEENEAPLDPFVGTVEIQRAFLDILNRADTAIYKPAADTAIWRSLITTGEELETVDAHPHTALYRAAITSWTSGKALVRLGA